MTERDVTVAPIIQARNITRRFGSLTAVDHLNLEVAPGEIFGLVGPDGAGKTTTLRLLCGLIDPAEGQATVTGHDPARHPEQVKDNIGYMAQRFGLYPDLSVDENMYFYADLFGISRSERDELLPRLLQMTRMDPFRKRLAGRLSGGMKQKLALMCTLLHRPRILFLDEPTNGVDPVSRRDFWRILYQLLKEGVTIFVSTAYLDEADRCHRVGLIHRGRLLACDTPDGLKGLMHGTILEVATHQARKAGYLLRERLTGTTVGLFGDRLHVVTHTPDETIVAIGTIFRKDSLAEPTIRTIEPSLEDVFVSVLGSSRATDQPTV